jgi:hypothetical protein
LLILAAVLLAAGALLAHLRLMPYVSPTAALRMRVFRDDARRLAAAFLDREGVRVPAGYRQVASFSVNEAAKDYLEQTLGLAAANRVMQRDAFVYGWDVRWFRPETQHEYYVTVDPDGRITDYVQYLADSEALPPSKNAEGVARAFLRRTAGIDVAGYVLKDRSVAKQTKRTDIRFIWERPGFTLGEATQRVRITVSGDRVIGYRRTLHIPEAYTHRNETEQAKGNTLADVAFVGIGLLTLLALAVVIIALVRRTLAWRSGLIAAALVTGVTLLNHVNELPLAFAQFDNTGTDFSFWSSHALGILMNLASTFAGTLVVVCAAEWLYRRAFPHHPPIGWWFSREGFSSTAGRARLLLGYWLIPVQLAFLTLFYLFAERYLHAWMPADVKYDDLFATGMPWAFALLMGIEAAVMEEFLCRVLAISFLKRVLKIDWLAILLPALIWGFAHCNYPNRPFFIRGIELTLWGIVFGIIFVRYGPLPSLIAHAGYNAVVTAESFLTSVTWLPRLNAVIVLVFVLLPLLLAQAWARRKPAEAPENAALEETLARETAAQAGPVPLRDDAADPPPRHRWTVPAGLLLLVLGVAVAGVIMYRDHHDARYRWHTGNANPLRAQLISRGRAIALAAGALRREGANVTGWKLAAVPNDTTLDEDTADYLADYLPDEDSDALAARVTVPDYVWVVSWQKPLARERWDVTVTADGRVWDVVREQPDEAPGARLPQAAARAKAEAALTALGIDPARLHLTGTERYDHPHRAEYDFTWEVTGLTVGEAQFLTDVTVDGDRVNGIDRYVEIPNTVGFDNARETLWQTVAQVLAVLAGLLLCGWGGAVYVQTLRTVRAPWRWGIGIGVLAVLAGLTRAVLELPRTWANLADTDVPSTFAMRGWLDTAMGLWGAGLMLALLLPVAAALWTQVFPTLPGPRAWWRALVQPARHASLWHEALVALLPLLGIVLLAGAVGIGVETLLQGASDGAGVQVPAWLVQALPALPGYNPTSVELMGFTDMDVWLPGLYLLLTAVLAGAGALLAWLVFLPFARRIFPRVGWALAAAGVLIALLAATQIRDTTDLLHAAPALPLGLCGLWAAYRLALRANPLVIVLAVATPILVSGAWTLLWFPAHRAGGIILLALVAAVYLWALSARPLPPPIDRELQLALAPQVCAED